MGARVRAVVVAAASMAFVVGVTVGGVSAQGEWKCSR